MPLAVNGPQPIGPGAQLATEALKNLPAVPNGSYWTGQDGNVWVAGSQGTHSAGAADGNTDAYWQSRGYTKQADPVAHATAPTNPNNTTTGTGSSAPAYADKSDDIKLNSAGLGSVDSQTNSGLAGVDSAFNNLIHGYDTERDQNEGNYHTQSDANTNNLQKNKQTAMVNAAEGRRGLFGTLSSLGALNGDGLTLANRAVQQGANEDLNSAADTYGTNQSSLETAITNFRNEDAARRQHAQTAADDAKTNVRNQAAKTKQGFYTNLANDYTAEGNTGEASRYTGMAADLYPEIANTSVPSTSLAPEAAAFTPATLQNYIAGANSTQVSTRPQVGGGVGPGSLPGLVASNDVKRRMG